MDKEIISKVKEVFKDVDSDAAILALSLMAGSSIVKKDGERITPSTLAHFILDGYSLERKRDASGSAFMSWYWEVVPGKGPECSCASHFKAFKRHAPLCKLEPK